MKRFRKFLLISLLSIIALTIISIIVIGGMFVSSNKVKFDIDKIKYSNTNINLYDNNNCPIKEENIGTSYVKLSELNDYTKQAFLSIEDKNFYNHNGLNYKRITKAMLKNITSLKIKEGASTISQQLIKNTHLSNEKTFKRKINEIILTKKLENKLSKNKILEYYLNIIYFGNNCYGIESASNYYFNKKAKDLNLSESATLAGMIRSPNTYSPTKNIEKSTKRRNVVLKEMLNDKIINFNKYNETKLEKISLNIKSQNNNKLNSYEFACIDEVCKILKMPAKQVAILEYKIYTYFDKEKQNLLNQSFHNYSPESDYAGISLDAKTGNIEAYTANSNIKLFSAKRQPGSVIKPIIVYTPALNENIISPLTQINDEKISINGYTPSNINGKCYGYISVRDAVSKSLNIPAVKVMSYVGTNKAISYAKKCGITFEETENNLSLALGGMTNGTTLKEITNAYTIFTNSGIYKEARFVNYITDKYGKIVYKNDNINTYVAREDSAYLMTDMLKTCAKEGTGRKLGDLNFEVATKTGTVGKSTNTDAWNISYTTKDIVGIWLGNSDNSPIMDFGGGKPTDISKDYLSKLYSKTKPANFSVPSSIYYENIDNLSLKDEHIVYKANNYIPEKYVVKEVFSRFNQPKEKSTKFISVNPPILDGKVENNKAILFFNAEDYLIYELYKKNGNNDQLLSVITNKNGECSMQFDIDKKSTYFIITKIKNFADNTEIISDKSNEITLIN